MREEFMKRIDARKKEIDDKNSQYDIASYPFGAEEMLLNKEIEMLELLNGKKLEKKNDLQR